MIQRYYQMPKKELLSIISRESNEIYLIKKQIRENWVKNNKCKCCNNDLIKSGKCVLTCKHLRKEWNNKTNQLDASLNMKFGVLINRNLNKVRKFANPENKEEMNKE